MFDVTSPGTPTGAAAVQDRTTPAYEIRTPAPPEPQVEWTIFPTRREMVGEAFGVMGTDIGEEGDFILIGHVEPRKAIAAWWRISRTEHGFGREDLFGTAPGEPSPPWDELLDLVDHRYAVFEAHAAGCPCGCEGGWVACWGERNDHGAFTRYTADDYGAVPITYISWQ